MLNGPMTLFYVEPLPIRGQWNAYQWVGEWWARLVALNDWTPEQVRFLANDQTRDLMLTYSQGLPLALSTEHFVEISVRTKTMLEDFAKLPWGGAGVAGWKELIQGHGPVADAIATDLEQVRVQQFAFEAVVLWGLNGAVRGFCERNGLACQNGELGATRAPLPQTIYFDPWGAHGNGLLPRSVCGDLPVSGEALELITGRFWSLSAPRVSSNAKRALLALQLADDANMLTIEGIDGPEGYVDFALPRLLDAGYEVVVKGHPLAFHRPMNAAVQERCFAKAERTPGVTVMSLSPRGEEYLPWLASFDLVAAISSSIVFEASLTGARTSLERAASFAAGDAMPRLEQAVAPGFDWDAQRERLARNAAFYLGGFALFDNESAGPELLRAAQLDRDLGASRSSRAYLEAWGRALSPRRLRDFKSVLGAR